jgi:hypothetical protein
MNGEFFKNISRPAMGGSRKHSLIPQPAGDKRVGDEDHREEQIFHYAGQVRRQSVPLSVRRRKSMRRGRATPTTLSVISGLVLGFSIAYVEPVSVSGGGGIEKNYLTSRKYGV